MCQGLIRSSYENWKILMRCGGLCYLLVAVLLYLWPTTFSMYQCFFTANNTLYGQLSIVLRGQWFDCFLSNGKGIRPIRTPEGTRSKIKQPQKRKLVKQRDVCVQGRRIFWRRKVCWVIFVTCQTEGQRRGVLPSAMHHVDCVLVRWSAGRRRVAVSRRLAADCYRRRVEYCS